MLKSFKDRAFPPKESQKASQGREAAKNIN